MATFHHGFETLVDRHTFIVHYTYSKFYRTNQKPKYDFFLVFFFCFVFLTFWCESIIWFPYRYRYYWWHGVSYFYGYLLRFSSVATLIVVVLLDLILHSFLLNTHLLIAFNCRIILFISFLYCFQFDVIPLAKLLFPMIYTFRK